MERGKNKTKHYINIYDIGLKDNNIKYQSFKKKKMLKFNKVQSNIVSNSCYSQHKK